jgi:hypothetical protein
MRRVLSILSFCIFIIVSSVYCIDVTQKTRYDINDVFTHDLKLIVQAKEFFIKGINYSPQPLGKPQDGGYCSVRKFAYGGTANGCAGEDYFDGNSLTQSINGNNPTPSGAWFQKIWDRDLPIIKETGANTIRIYHMEAVTKTLLQKYPNDFPNNDINLAPVHRPFFDAAEKYGLRVIAPIVTEEGVLLNNDEATLQKFIEARVDEIGDHPALIMWKIGNELGLCFKPELVTIVNKAMKYTREYTLKKWNRIVPITTAEIDLPTCYVPLAAELLIDVYTSNAGYRDVYIDGLWYPDSNPDNKMPGWKVLSEYYDLPILVGEFGMHDQDDVTAARPEWINAQWKNMVDHKVDGGIGGLFFEFNEETTKPANQQHMGIVKFTVTTDANTEKSSNQPGVFSVIDGIQKKPIVFSALKSGFPGDYQDYCFTKDVYALTGTTQLVVDLSKITPKPFVTRRTPFPDADSSINPPAPAPGPGPAPVPNPPPPTIPIGPHSDTPQSSYRINCGGPDYTDSKGNNWIADNYFNHGTVSAKVNDAVSNTNDQSIYQTERYEPAQDPLIYSLNLYKGAYTINLYFAEVFIGLQGVGRRVFAIQINGKTVAPAFDIYKVADGGYKAVIMSYNITLEQDSIVPISFAKGTENQKINGVEAIRTSGGNVDPPPVVTSSSKHTVPEESDDGHTGGHVGINSEEIDPRESSANTGLTIIQQLLIVLITTLGIAYLRNM